MVALSTTPTPAFDCQINALRHILSSWEDRLVHMTMDTDLDATRTRLRMLPRKANRAVIVVGEQVGLELGHPSTASANAVLWTCAPEDIRPGRIHLLGPDLAEAAQGRLPFAQLVLLCLRPAPALDIYSLLNAQYLINRLPGYMVRSLPGRLWARISRERLQDGFSLKNLADALAAACAEVVDMMTLPEIVFVTSSREDVASLHPACAEARIVSGQNANLSLSEDGQYECTTLTCETCDERPVCDAVRGIRIKGRDTDGR